MEILRLKCGALPGWRCGVTNSWMSRRHRVCSGAVRSTNGYGMRSTPRFLSSDSSASSLVVFPAAWTPSSIQRGWGERTTIGHHPCWSSTAPPTLCASRRYFTNGTTRCLHSPASPSVVLPYHPPHPVIPTNPVVFMDIAVEGDVLGRVTMELFRDCVPKAAEHFRSLCTGERGGGNFRGSTNYSNPRSLGGEGAGGFSYQGVPFHRIVSGFVVQGGDIMTRDGRSNWSLLEYGLPHEYEGVTAADGGPAEDLRKSRHHLPGTVALAHINGDPHRNGSQFFFNLNANAHLDNKFVVVGQVLSGWEKIYAVSRSCGSRSGVPVSRSWIVSCGQCGGYLEEEANAALRDSETSSTAATATHTLLRGREVLDALPPRL